MNVTIIYFSQTGNTRKVADAIAESFLSSGHNVRTFSMLKDVPVDAYNCDLLGIGAPCFSSQAPVPVMNFLKSMPQLEMKRSFIFVTSGAAPGRVMYDLGSAMRAKNSDIAGSLLIHAECFHPAPCLRGRMIGRPDAGDLVRARRFAENVEKHVSSGRPGFTKDSRPDTFKITGGLYDFVALFNKPGFLRVTMPKPEIQKDLCNGCKWCVKECPMKNIKMEEYPVIGSDCIRCYRCLNGCPQHAYKANWTFGNMAVKSFYNPLFIRLFGDLEPGEKIYI